MARMVRKGVLAISRIGKTVIVQDTASAEYLGMPPSAIDTGVVDDMLPLSSIAEALVRIVQAEAPATA